MLDQFRDIHKGDRCFIVGTGPSLNDTNLDLLKGEIIFGVNQCYNLPQLDFKYFCILDHKVIALHPKINEFTTYRGITTFCPNWARAYLPSAIPYTLRRIEPTTLRQAHWGDVTEGVYNKCSVVGIAMQFAYFMGFTRVGLVGCDCKHYDDQTKNHFDGSPVDNILRTKESGISWRNVFRAYKISRIHYNLDCRSIVNCTVGGDLEVFERRSLEKEIAGRIEDIKI